MKLYCTREKRTDSHGVARDEQTLCSVGEVENLRRCPEFCILDEPFTCKNHERRQVFNAEYDNNLRAARSRKMSTEDSSV